MYCIYTLSLSILLIILVLLLKEERRFRNSFTHGLASKYWVLREKRRYIRFNKEMKIRYNLLTNPSGLENSKTVNISKKGVCILTYEKLKKKSYLDLEIEIPGFSKSIRLVGKVMWAKDLKNLDEEGRRLFYAGLKFSKIKPEDEAILLTHLGKLKSTLRNTPMASIGACLLYLASSGLTLKATSPLHLFF